MISNDEHLHQAQLDIQTIWRFLEAARKTHTSLDYQRLAAPYLLQLQERQQDVVEYLVRQSSPFDTDPA
jgi:DNA-binding IclR family transcriptional regulator